MKDAFENGIYCFHTRPPDDATDDTAQIYYYQRLCSMCMAYCNSCVHKVNELNKWNTKLWDSVHNAAVW